MGTNQLGQGTVYPGQYDPGLLFAIPRADNRSFLPITPGDALPFTGADIWNAYELSWLDTKGLPQVARGRFIFPCTSPRLIESKSLKLYLNSLNQQQFASDVAVQECISRDLAAASGAEVQVLLQAFRGMQELLEAPDGTCLDGLDVECGIYHPESSLLALEGDDQPFEALVDEVLYTDLFRSLCPVTGQPDWATITICYRGRQISPGSLLRYLVSFRLHQDFHENCVERIYSDIRQQCQPQSLLVEANFLRRGGLDINPVRASDELMDYVHFPRYNRQ